MFGTRNPWTLSLREPQTSQLLPSARGTVALLDDPVQSEGDVFAFTARIYDKQPFHFQIWRPTDEKNKLYQLMNSQRVVPSVTKQHEDVSFTPRYVSFLISFKTALFQFILILLSKFYYRARAVSVLGVVIPSVRLSVTRVHCDKTK